MGFSDHSMLVCIFFIMLWKSKIIIIKDPDIFAFYISGMLSSSLDSLLKVSKTTILKNYSHMIAQRCSVNWLLHLNSFKDRLWNLCATSAFRENIFCRSCKKYVHQGVPLNCYLRNGCSSNSVTEGKRMLEPCRVRKNICFKILAIPSPSDASKPYRGFLDMFLRNYTLNKFKLIQLLHVIFFFFFFTKKKHFIGWGCAP